MEEIRKIDPDSQAKLDELIDLYPEEINSIADIKLRRIEWSARYKHSFIDVDPSMVPLKFYAKRLEEKTSSEIRIYSPKSKKSKLHPGLIFIHGGGMIMGDLDRNDNLCKKLAAKLNIVVASLDYRKAPEFPYPAAVDDCLNGVNWVFNNAFQIGIDLKNIGIYGNSAGGGLVIATALKLRDGGSNALKYMLPIYPMIDDRNITKSSREIVNFKIWDRAANLQAWKWYLGKLPADQYAAPARAQNLELLPPCYSDVGEFDLFKDENILFFQRLKASNVPTQFRVFDGAFHGSEIIAPESNLSKEIWNSRYNALSAFISETHDS